MRKKHSKLERVPMDPGNRQLSSPLQVTHEWDTDKQAMTIKKTRLTKNANSTVFKKRKILLSRSWSADRILKMQPLQTMYGHSKAFPAMLSFGCSDLTLAIACAFNICSVLWFSVIFFFLCSVFLTVKFLYSFIQAKSTQAFFIHTKMYDLQILRNTFTLCAFDSWEAFTTYGICGGNRTRLTSTYASQ